MKEQTGYGTTTQMMVNGAPTYIYCLITNEYLIYGDIQRHNYVGVVFKTEETDSLWQIKLKGAHDPETCTTSLQASIAILVNRATKVAEQESIKTAEMLRWRSNLQGRSRGKQVEGMTIE